MGGLFRKQTLTNVDEQASNNVIAKYHIKGVKIGRLSDNYIIINQIKSGAYGTVYKVQRKSDNKFFAVKCISLYLQGADNQDKYLETINREVTFHQTLKSNYILKLEDKCFTSEPTV